VDLLVQEASGDMKKGNIQFLSPPESPFPAEFHERLKSNILGMMGIPKDFLSVSGRSTGNVRVEEAMIERRIKNGDELDGTVVVWEKFECDCGCRWTQVKGHTATHKDCDPCDYSGCDKGHVIHKVGETSDRDEASAWYRNTHEEKRG